MKMISRSKNNRGRNRAIVVGVGFALCAALIIFTGLFSKTFYGTMVALSGGRDNVGQAASTFASVFKSKASLESQNAELRKLLAEKEVLLSDHDFLAKENADWKASTHFKQDSGRTLVRVLSKPPFTPFDVVVVAAGESDGVKIGDRVMLGEIYLGSVEHVDEDSSRIKLFSSPDADIESYIGDDAVPALLSGKGGGNFETSLPQGSNVSEGDLVVSYHGDSPFMVGKVSKVIDNNDNTFMTILLALPFNLYSLTYVEIISS
jgi:cell shape-determining protein MreC